MTQVIVTSPADADTVYIMADLGAKAGARVALRYLANFDRVYERLANFPGSGAPRPALGRHVRICIVSPYNIFYEYLEDDDTVTIMRIAHGRRKITRKFLHGQ